MLHQALHELERHRSLVFQLWSVVVIFNGNRVEALIHLSQRLLGPVDCDGSLECHFFHDFVALDELFLGIGVVGPSLADQLEVRQSQLELAEAHVGGCPAVVGLQVSWV